MSGTTVRRGKPASQLSKIVSALPSLSSKELLTVKAALEQLLWIAKEPPEEDAYYLYCAILDKLDVVRQWGSFVGTAAHKDFAVNAPGAVLFITQTFKSKNRTQTIAVMRMLLDLLLVDLSIRNIPLTVGTVCRNLHLLPMAFDDAFPDYRKSRLIPMLMKQMEK